MSGGKPVIGVGWPKPDYLEALTRADADPFVIAPDRDAISTVLDRCDGLLLTGGADVEPRRYGESIRYDNLKLDPTRDEYEIALIQAALARDVPILAICRGIQALNVAAGGTLVQDIPSEIATPISHKGDRWSDLRALANPTLGSRAGSARVLEPEYNISDVRLGISSASGAWTVEGYITNLWNTDAIILVNTGNYDTRQTTNEPRVIGVHLSYRFNGS